MSTDTSRLIDFMDSLICPLGYETVHIELLQGRQKVLRVFIDFADAATAESKAIGIQDCVTVSRTLDEPLDTSPDLERLFGGASYELEVSSPGVDRPLRQAKDYERFKGREVKVHVFRPLTGDELSNAAYQAKNPKQKNFLGKLKGLREERILLAVPMGKTEEEISIPLPLIAKANLEPKFEFDRESEI